MKKILVVVFALIVFGQVNAKGVDPNSPVGMSVLKSGSIVKLFYRGEQSGKVKVKIYNEHGYAVFIETMANTEDFMRPYNFSSLPEGKYVIEVIDEKGTSSRSINYTKTKTAKVQRIAHVVALKSDEGKYLLTVPNVGKEQLTVRIFNGERKLLYENTQVIRGNFAKVYNLAELKGKHTFEIMDRDGGVSRIDKVL